MCIRDSYPTGHLRREGARLEFQASEHSPARTEGGQHQARPLFPKPPPPWRASEAFQNEGQQQKKARLSFSCDNLYRQQMLSSNVVTTTTSRDDITCRNSLSPALGGLVSNPTWLPLYPPGCCREPSGMLSRSPIVSCVVSVENTRHETLTTQDIIRR